MTTIRLSLFFPVDPAALYLGWLDSDEHSSFSGSEASIDPSQGGSFTAWDGYISGRNLVLEPFRRILQSWRTTDFPANAPDSRLELLFEPSGKGTQLVLIHSDFPPEQKEVYAQGWKDYYLDPMTDYFGEK
ncbi:MAG: SRPBCC domain-containing protein [Bacteroidetes bacterium]|nr:SRPBCC domain-containing protein [Bacteroidota bacterium]